MKKNSAFTYMMLIYDSFQALFGSFSISQFMVENRFVVLYDWEKLFFKAFWPSATSLFLVVNRLSGIKR